MKGEEGMRVKRKKGNEGKTMYTRKREYERRGLEKKRDTKRKKRTK